MPITPTEAPSNTKSVFFMRSRLRRGPSSVYGMGMQQPWWAGTGHFAKSLSALVVVASLALTGCGQAPSSQTAPPPADHSADDSADPTPAPTEPQDPAKAPSTPPEGVKFTFDQAARWDDGLTVEISTIKKAKANENQRGAEGTEGDIVIAEILVSNETKAEYDTSVLRVWGYYGFVGAPKIIDSTRAVGDSFSGTIPPGGKAKAAMAWAIPADSMEEVTIMVDGNSPSHGKLQFTGPVTEG